MMITEKRRKKVALSNEGDLRGFAPYPTREVTSLDPAPAVTAWHGERAICRCCLEEMIDLAAIVLLARPLKSGQPGCKASGESQGKIP